MSNFDDLLALFPDNSTGEISAADMRQAMTLIAEVGQGNQARITALEQQVPTVGVSVSGVWQIDPTPASVPSAGEVTCDTGLFGTASYINFDKHASGGIDFSSALANAVSIYVQQQNDSTNWIRYSVNGPVVDGGSYTQVTVTVEDAGGVPGTGAWQAAVFVIAGAP